MTFLIEFLYSQLFVSLPYPQTNFSNQTIIVTGANVGLGFEAARHFTRLGASKVILGVRSQSKGQVAQQQIQESTGRKNVVEVWPLDLASYVSVKEFAKKAGELERLDAVVANAGIFTKGFVLVEDNESTITVNVVSTFLLALLVLPILRQTAQKFSTLPHLVVVSSDLHHLAGFKERKSENIFQEMNDKKPGNMGDRYNVSKLLEILIVRELAKRMSQSTEPELVINCLNPGFCYSGLQREVKGFEAQFNKVFKRLIGRSTEVGSRTLVSAASAGKESHGQYLSDCHVAKVASWIEKEDGKKVQLKVWGELIQKLEAIQLGISENV